MLDELNQTRVGARCARICALHECLGVHWPQHPGLARRATCEPCRCLESKDTWRWRKALRIYRDGDPLPLAGSVSPASLRLYLDRATLWIYLTHVASSAVHFAGDTGMSGVRSAGSG